ncbi:hypothetical protein B0H10DRAFT_2230111 [Mycena sp. CBHHK59/15]|nr:hypothetical protein B0H10DRAFT_2230111 [Mycena sp. CBHHK59/15]
MLWRSAHPHATRLFARVWRRPLPLTSACTPSTASTPPPSSSLSHASRARPPFLSAAAAALLLYDPSTYSPFLLGPGAFLANKDHCRARDTPPYGQLSTALVPCPTSVSAHGPSVHLDTASTPSMHIRTDFVQSPRHPVHPNPPVPSLMRSSRVDLSRTRAPISTKQRRRFLGNWAVWAPAAMRFTHVALVIYGSTALASASLAISSGLSSSPTDWDLERVLTAIRASVSEAPANPGMGTRCIHLHVLLLPDNLHFHNVFVVAPATAECTRARTFGKVGVFYTGAASTLPLAVVLIAVQHLILGTQHFASENNDSSFSFSSRSRPHNQNVRKSTIAQLFNSAGDTGQDLETQSGVFAVIEMDAQPRMDEFKTSCAPSKSGNPSGSKVACMA